MKVIDYVSHNWFIIPSNTRQVILQLINRVGESKDVYLADSTEREINRPGPYFMLFHIQSIALHRWNPDPSEASGKTLSNFTGARISVYLPFSDGWAWIAPAGPYHGLCNPLPLLLLESSARLPGHTEQVFSSLHISHEKGAHSISSLTHSNQNFNGCCLFWYHNDSIPGD